MDELLPLPDPSSAELREILRTKSLRELYAILYFSRDAPLTDVEIGERFAQVSGSRQSQLGRRRRDLNRDFLVQKVREPGDVAPRYLLVGRRARPLNDRGQVSLRQRYDVLARGKCERCGRTVADHGVVLEVDHIIPLAWGGTNDRANLQALCQECNAGKKDAYADLEKYGPAIAEAASEPDVHRRLAALLVALSPHEVPSDVLRVVANHGEAQEDWQKRLRELRELGWDYSFRKQRNSQGVVETYYRVTRHRPLPDGPLRPHIRAAEAAKKAARKTPPR